MQSLLDGMLDKYVPQFPEQLELSIPELNLPKLQKL